MEAKLAYVSIVSNRVKPGRVSRLDGLTVSLHEIVGFVSALPEWLTAIGTLGLAVVAVFQDWFRSLVIHPRLRLEARVARPDAEKTAWSLQPVIPASPRLPSFTSSMEAPVYYFRLAVTNIGNAEARDVQVFVASVEQKRDGRYEPVQRFSPMNLCWSHVGTPTISILLPGMPPRYCDFAHITDPQAKVRVGEALDSVGQWDTVLALDTEVKPNSLGHLFEPGHYRFALKLAASNHPPHDYTLDVIFPGRWFDEEEQMFSAGFEMHLRT